MSANLLNLFRQRSIYGRSFFYLKLNLLFSIFWNQNWTREVMAIVRPWKCKEEFVVWIVNDRVLRVSRVFSLLFNYQVWMLLSVLFVFVRDFMHFFIKNFNAILGVACYLVTIHGPVWFIYVKHMEERPLFCYDLSWTFECFLIKIAWYLGLA